VVDYGFSRGLKWIFFPFNSADSPLYMQDLINYVNPAAKYGLKYGEDWVILQLSLGGEPALASFANNIRYSDVDVFGNPIANMPILQGIYTLHDIPLAIFVTYAFSDYLMYIRQWGSIFKEPLLSICQFANIAEYYNIYVFGDLDWITGLAEFEYSTNRAAEEVINLDARNTIIYFMFGIVAFGMISRLESSRKMRRIEKKEVVKS
jgi:hypothetical protein